jgi:hypothetical protein
MKRRSLLATACLMGAGMGHAQTPSPAASAAAAAPRFASDDIAHALKLRDAGLADKQAWTLLQQLCNDIGPRPAGSANDAKAVAWAQTALRGLGLQNVRAEAIPLRVWQRGPASAVLRVPGANGALQNEPLVMAALGNSVPTPPEGIEAEIAWYASFDALKADDPATSRARGRIVVIDQKMERARDGSGYGPAVAARGQGAVEAARRGALAVGIRSIGTDRAPIAHTGAMRYDLSVPRIPAFAMSVPDAERVAALHAAGKPLRLALQLQAKSNVEALTHNVIAEVPGTDLADEVVLIGGHLDSWDLGRGAQDDGAGCTISAAAAGVIQAAGRRPRRTVRAVLFANEENGFDGATAYSERYKAVTHQLVGESDFGAGRIYQLDSRVQPAALPLFGEMAQVLAPLGVAWRGAGDPALRGRNTGSPGPDAAYLMRRNRWPGVQLSQDGTNYFDIHHTEHDTLDRIEPAALQQNVACWAAVAWLAAQAPVGFGPPVL